VPGLDFFTPEKKIRANIRYWEAKVLLSRIGTQDREKRGVLRSPEIDDSLGSRDLLDGGGLFAMPEFFPGKI
jgi:hypothetical protein